MKRFASPSPSTWVTDVTCNCSIVAPGNHLPIIAYTSKRYQTSECLKLAMLLNLPQVSGVAKCWRQKLIQNDHYLRPSRCAMFRSPIALSVVKVQGQLVGWRERRKETNKTKLAIVISEGCFSLIDVRSAGRCETTYFIAIF